MNYSKCNPKIDFNKVDTLIIVAHPDDELLFFSKYLLNYQNILVLCMTNGGNRVRLCEFTDIMKFIGCKYKIFNFKDSQYIEWDEKKVLKKINKFLKIKKWKKVITHNREGEYGHIQHKQLNKIIRNLKLENIYTSNSEEPLVKMKNKLSNSEYEKKVGLANKFYKSQIFVFKNMNEYVRYERELKNKF